MAGTPPPGDHDRWPPPGPTVVGQPLPRGAMWIWLREDLDLATVERARTELAAALDGVPVLGRVLVHLGAERFVALRGLQMLVEVAGDVRSRGGALAVVAPPTSLQLLVDHLGLHDELPAVPTVGSAIRSLAQRPG